MIIKVKMSAIIIEEKARLKARKKRTKNGRHPMVSAA